MFTQESLNIISVNFFSILFSLLNLVIIFLIAKFLLYKPVKKMLEGRQKTIEDGYRYMVKICGPSSEVQNALSGINGVKSVEATGQRDMDSYAFIVESDNGIDVRKSVFNLCSGKGWAIIGMEAFGMSLEDIFISAVNETENKDETRSKKSGKERNKK